MMFLTTLVLVFIKVSY